MRADASANSPKPRSDGTCGLVHTADNAMADRQVFMWSLALKVLTIMVVFAVVVAAVTSPSVKIYPTAEMPPVNVP